MELKSIDIKYNFPTASGPDDFVEVGPEKEKVQVRTLIDQLKAGEDRPIRAIIFWDDVVQLTSYRVLELLIAQYKLPIKASLNAFLERDEVYGYEYVESVVKKFGITAQVIREFYKRNYREILFSSKTSDILHNIMDLKASASKIHFVFRYDLPDLHDLISSIQSTKIPRDQNPIITYSVLNGMSEEDFFTRYLSEKPGDCDMIFALDGGMVYQQILYGEHVNKTIVCPINHNGIEPNIFLLFQFHTNGVGFNQTIVYPYDEFKLLRIDGREVTVMNGGT